MEPYKKKEPSPQRERLKSVVGGNVTIQKKSSAKRFAELFLAEDVASVKSYILTELIVPKLKDTAEDILHAVLYGQGPRRKNGVGSGQKTFYGGYYTGPKEPTYRQKNIFDYGELTFENANDAKMVLQELQEALQDYSTVSVADLYDLAGKSISNEQANKYGWIDLSSAKVSYVSGNGYVLILPKPMPLD